MQPSIRQDKTAMIGTAGLIRVERRLLGTRDYSSLNLLAREEPKRLKARGTVVALIVLTL